MRKWKVTALIAVMLISLLLTSYAQAMTSTNYRLDWFTPMTGGGGGSASCAYYAANFTVGQTVIGGSTSEHYWAGLGYWYGLPDIIRNFVPLVMKN